MLFDLPTWALALTIVVVVFGATALGAWIGSRSRHLGTNLSEPLGVLQGALLGVVGLILAFGLSLALSRYEDRRATVVAEANAIGTTYLRAQMLEPRFSAPSLRLLDQYAESAVDVADRIPDSDAEMDAIAAEERIQGRLWLLARAAVADQPVQTAPRLYIETLNEMIDAQATRQAALANRVPTPVLLLELFGAAVALALLAGYLALIGRGTGAVFLVAALVSFLLFVTADLDRPTRGLIKVPDTPLANDYGQITDTLESGTRFP
ncbi:MAG: hypothetical protein KDB58_03645 [Solirubrobacterales bacterium]|nr:hypothetical protein [Solirubrobacterales bacterium]MCB8971738.1 hypothetical protein [Thermoleophilales bacterium]MCO5327296.1 phage GP46 family protein [Solirubrobacterales bacterium]